MSKELIILVSTEGKTPDQIAAEAWAGFVKYRAELLGLKKCETCGEYKGAAIDDGEAVKVDCICDGATCSVCKQSRIHRPISNYFNENEAKIIHVPYFSSVCRPCRNSVR